MKRKWKDLSHFPHLSSPAEAHSLSLACALDTTLLATTCDSMVSSWFLDALTLDHDKCHILRTVTDGQVLVSLAAKAKLY